MPCDALNYQFLTNELNSQLSGGRIDKVNMPSADTVILTIHNNKNNYHLLLSANPSRPRCHLTSLKNENPTAALAFLMHLRKHIVSAKILEISLVPFERIIKLNLECHSDLGFIVSRVLIVEIMGKYSNIILVNDDGKISDSVFHITPDISSKRLVLPGLAYSTAPRQNKIDLQSENDLTRLIDTFKGGRIDAFLLSNVSGLSPSSISEAIFNAGIPKTSEPFSHEKSLELSKSLLSLFDEKKLNPCVNLDVEKKDFFIYPYNYLASEKYKFFGSLSEAMDAFYLTKEREKESSEKTKELLQAVKNAISRDEKKLVKFEEKRKDCLNLEDDQLFGELITSNLYKLKGNADKVVLENYYNNTTVTIPLNKELSPVLNAQKYYKSYNKKKKTLSMLEGQTLETLSELDYYNSILANMNMCETKAEIAELVEELTKCGLLKAKKTSKKPLVSTPIKTIFKGYSILVGKNNIQNDTITKKAKPNYLWLHTQKIHGSHVIIECEKVPDDDVILFAASLAAYYSKARQSDNVPVDYTFIKNVSKPSGAPFGKVVYTNQKTVFVKPAGLDDILN